MCKNTKKSQSFRYAFVGFVPLALPHGIAKEYTRGVELQCGNTIAYILNSHFTIIFKENNNQIEDIVSTSR